MDEEFKSWNKDSPVKVLDIGAGTGNQVKKIKSIFPSAEIYALDYSVENILSIQNLGFEKVSTAQLDMNDYHGMDLFLEKETDGFDIVLAFFSIYHANSLQKILDWIQKKCKANAKTILVGYSKFNNQELVKLSFQFSGDDYSTHDFFPTALEIELNRTHLVQSYYFYNDINFSALDQFTHYYKNYGLYAKNLESKIGQHVQNEIQLKGYFRLSKVSQVIVIEKVMEFAATNLLPPNILVDKFGLKKYNLLLKNIRDLNYNRLSFSNIFTENLHLDSRYLLLRHDVDNSLENALRMAEIEAQNGICATYYILVSGGFFNLLTSKNRLLLKELVTFGHEIGLHFDQKENFYQDKIILESLLELPIQTYSQHNPTINGIYSIDHSNLINAYNPKIREELGFNYISDSGMKWRKEDCFQGLNHRRLYLLLHPEIWCSEGMDLVQSLRKIESNEIINIRRKYNEYISGNIAYLHSREKQL